ncbi:MAG: biopolymer transporter ExbD [Halobacteriovoraceae bacterium]|nr:biopolymer transporter ExbD [Halobacteriovoraceae bacterium]
MLKRPTRNRKKRKDGKINLIPILDSIFIFIFFLLTTANFTKIFQIASDVPIVSDTPPASNQNPLALTAYIGKSNISLHTGIPSKPLKSFGMNAKGEYDLESLHNYLVNLKKRFKKEKSIILEPLIDIEFQNLVNIMDAVRMFRTTDDSIYIRGNDGVDQKIEELFSNIVFGNIKGR